MIQSLRENPTHQAILVHLIVPGAHLLIGAVKRLKTGYWRSLKDLENRREDLNTQQQGKKIELRHSLCQRSAPQLGIGIEL